MTTASRSEREALYLESVESSKDPRDAGPRGKDPGRPWGRTRQSKEAENAFINPRSWPGRRTAVDGADQVVMACVGGWWWWQDRQSQKKKSGKKKKEKEPPAGPSVVVSRQTVAHARAKRPSTRGPGPPRWPSPPPGQSDGPKPARERDGGQGGRAGGEWRAVRRFAGATPFRRCGVAVPTLRQAHHCPTAEGGQWRLSICQGVDDGTWTVHRRAPKIPSTSLSPSGSSLPRAQRPRLERRPTAPQATFSSSVPIAPHR